MRWFSLAVGACGIAAMIWGVFVGRIGRDPSGRAMSVKGAMFYAAGAGYLLATGIQPPPDVMTKVNAVVLLLAGAGLLQYLRPPAWTFERYRDERLYPSILQAWAVAVGSLALALIVNGLLLLLQWVFPDFDLLVAQLIVTGVAALVFVAAVWIGGILAIGMRDEAAMESWRREPRQP